MSLSVVTHETRPLGVFGNAASDALKWLDVAEQLNVALPAEYAEKRRDWQRLVGLA